MSAAFQWKKGAKRRWFMLGNFLLQGNLILACSDHDRFVKLNIRRVLTSNGGKENSPEIDRPGGRLLETLEYASEIISYLPYFPII